MNKIWVRVEYTNYYNLINKINYVGIKVYDVKKLKNELLFSTTYDDYNRLVKYIKSYKFKIYKKTGFSYIYFLIKNNILIFISIILSIILFFIFNNVIISSEILHESDTLRELVLYELNKRGVKPLTLKKDYSELTKIKEEILELYPDKLDWIEIETIGMKYVIKVEERIITQKQEEDTYCNVYAKEDGMITDISVYKGVSVVSRGDYVKKGDLLISGDILLYDEVKERVCAEGIVKAEKWYETDVVLPLVYYEEVLTGESRYNLSIEHENKDTKLLRDRLDNFITKEKELFDIFGYVLYLEKNYEIEKTEKRYSEEEGISRALSLVDDKINITLNEKETIKEKKVLKKVVNNSTIELRVFIITEEIIN